MPDTELHELFSPLREAESTHDPAAIAARRRRRPQLRYALALGGAAAVATTLVLAAPSSDPAAPSGAGVLRAAAAVAADQPPPQTGEGYRYIRTDVRVTISRREDDREATITYETPTEDWLDADMKGREKSQKSRVVAQEGDPKLIERLKDDIRLFTEQEHNSIVDLNGFGPRYRPENLPTDPDLLRRELERGVAADDPKSDTGISMQEAVVSKAMSLLENANAQPQLRAALFEVLASMPGNRSLGSVQDRLGRTGHGVMLTSFDYETTLVIDPDTAEVLSQSGRRLHPGLTEDEKRLGLEYFYTEYERLITATVQVRAIGERP